MLYKRSMCRLDILRYLVPSGITTSETKILLHPSISAVTSTLPAAECTNSALGVVPKFKSANVAFLEPVYPPPCPNYILCVTQGALAIESNGGVRTSRYFLDII
jgi:hypothetical protein